MARNDPELVAIRTANGSTNLLEKFHSLDAPLDRPDRWMDTSRSCEALQPSGNGGLSEKPNWKTRAAPEPLVS